MNRFWWAIGFPPGGEVRNEDFAAVARLIERRERIRSDGFARARIERGQGGYWAYRRRYCTTGRGFRFRSE